MYVQYTVLVRRTFNIYLNTYNGLTYYLIKFLKSKYVFTSNQAHGECVEKIDGAFEADVIPAEIENADHSVGFDGVRELQQTSVEECVIPRTKFHDMPV